MGKISIENEIQSYTWAKRRSVYIGEKIVEENVIERLLIDTASKKAKIKRNGKDYYKMTSRKLVLAMSLFIIENYKTLKQ